MVVPVESVAAWFQGKDPSVPGMKLQKLLYYAQAWHLAWEGRPLFTERLEAWAQGPVSPHVFGVLSHEVRPLAAQPLPPEVLATLDGVLQGYGSRSGKWLSELTHREAPWRTARAGLPDDAASKAEISQELMRQTYASHRYGVAKTFSPAYLRGLELMVELPADELELMSKTVEPEASLRWLETGAEE
jgi:uncharacterized phage-associated protein